MNPRGQANSELIPDFGQCGLTSNVSFNGQSRENNYRERDQVNPQFNQREDYQKRDYKNNVSFDKANVFQNERMSVTQL